MEKIYHVFVSSTYRDLKDERRLVSDSIARAGYVPEGMEIFPASSQKQIDFIRSVISRCDFYILIIAGKYGSALPDGRSYTRAEYEIALELNLPILAFLHRDIKTLPASEIEDAGDNRDRLSEFRALVEQTSVVDYWLRGDDLAARALAALAQEANRNPGRGWIRGDQAASGELYRELSILRKQNEALLSEVAALSASIPEEAPSSKTTLTLDKGISIRYVTVPKFQNALSPQKPITRVLKLTPKEVLVSTALAFREANTTRPLLDFMESKIEPNRTSTAYQQHVIEIQNDDVGVLTMAMCSLGLWEDLAGSFRLTEQGRAAFLAAKIS